MLESLLAVAGPILAALGVWYAGVRPLIQRHGDLRQQALLELHAEMSLRLAAQQVPPLPQRSAVLPAAPPGDLKVARLQSTLAQALTTVEGVEAICVLPPQHTAHGGTLTLRFSARAGSAALAAATHAVAAVKPPGLSIVIEQVEDVATALRDPAPPLTPGAPQAWVADSGDITGVNLGSPPEPAPSGDDCGVALDEEWYAAHPEPASAPRPRGPFDPQTGRPLTPPPSRINDVVK